LSKLLLERAKKESPKPLETAGMFDKIVTDPGLVVLVKALPRKDYKASAKNPGGGQRPSRGPGVAPGGGTPTDKKQQLEQEWWDVSKRLVETWCLRFQKASAAKEDAATGAEDASARAAPKLPEDLALGPEAETNADFHVLWPDKAPPQYSALKLGSLEVYYVRAKESGKLKKLKAAYIRKAQARATDVHSNDRGGVWIDGAQHETANGHRRSIDVLISRSDSNTTIAHPPGVGTPKEEDVEADYIIEILSIEIKDPNGQ
jgi:hypothetical protein